MMIYSNIANREIGHSRLNINLSLNMHPKFISNKYWGNAGFDKKNYKCNGSFHKVINQVLYNCHVVPSPSIAVNLSSCQLNNTPVSNGVVARGSIELLSKYGFRQQNQNCSP